MTRTSAPRESDTGETTLVCSVLPVSAALHGTEVVERLVAAYGPLLSGSEVRVVSTVEAATPRAPFALLVVTGGSEQRVLDAWRARQQLVRGEPVLLLTHGGDNSLPAALEGLARIQRDGGHGRIVAVEPGDSGAAFTEAVHDLVVWHTLQRARVGLVGTPSDWLVASVPDPAGLHRRWGVTLVDVALPEVMDRFDENIEAPIAEPVTIRARHHDRTPHPAEIETAARLEPVLRSITEEQGLAAVAVRCFDLVTDAHTSGCLALSALNDRNVVAGCEGDVASTIGLLWTKLVTGRTGWMANPVRIDTTTGIVELAHCTVPLSIVEGYHLDTHFESDLGVAIAGEFRPGPVTLVRLGGDELQQLWCADGEALVTPARPGRCRTQLDVRIDPADAAHVLEHPLGNHLVVQFGHHADRLRAWWQAMIA